MADMKRRRARPDHRRYIWRHARAEGRWPRRGEWRFIVLGRWPGF